MIKIDGDVLGDDMVSIFEIARQFRFETLLALDSMRIDRYLDSMRISNVERREDAVRRHRIGIQCNELFVDSANQSEVQWK